MLRKRCLHWFEEEDQSPRGRGNTVDPSPKKRVGPTAILGEFVRGLCGDGETVVFRETVCAATGATHRRLPSVFVLRKEVSSGNSLELVYGQKSSQVTDTQS